MVEDIPTEIVKHIFGNLRSKTIGCIIAKPPLSSAPLLTSLFRNYYFFVIICVGIEGRLVGKPSNTRLKLYDSLIPLLDIRSLSLLSYNYNIIPKFSCMTPQRLGKRGIETR